MSMFSTNQIFDVSGSLEHSDELRDALEFALKAFGNLVPLTIKEKLVKYTYQITEDGKYCIGWCYRKPEEGWTEFPFDYDIDIISQIVRQHLEKKEYPMTGIRGDGSYEKGFLVSAIDRSMADECNGIKNPFYGIVQIIPFTCFYAK